MLTILIFLILNLLCVSATYIEYRTAKVHSKLTFNTTNKQLNSQTIDPSTIGIYKVIYQDHREEITQVSQLPLLQNFHIRNAKQRFIPQFSNVPKFNYLSLEKNEIVFVAKESLSYTPLVYIDLKFNKILRIEHGSIPPLVKHIYLACNMLTRIESEWFQNPAKLEVLDMDANRIETIEENLLKDFVKLDYIYLMHNGLHTIGDGAFSHKNFISEMWLAYNHLTRFQDELFQKGKMTIELLDISFNKLSYLPFELMARLNISKTPHLDGNPWNCPCYIPYILKWVNWEGYGELTDPDRPGEPRCVASKGYFKDKCSYDVDLEAIGYFERNSSPPPENKNIYCQTKKF